MIEVYHLFATESYRRFYLHSLEGVVAVRNHYRAWFNAVCLMLAIAFAALMAAILGNRAAGVFQAPGTGTFLAEIAFVGAVPLVFAIMILVNTLRGAGCRCYFQVADQLQPVDSLRRLPAVRRVAALRKAVRPAAGTAGSTA